MSRWKPTDFSKKVEDDVDAYQRQKALEILRALTVQSPVDTGRFKGNWRVGLSVKREGEVSYKDKGGAATLQRGFQVIERQKDGQDIWISNNLPYAERLNEGWSDFAAPYMVERILRKVSGRDTWVF